MRGFYRDGMTIGVVDALEVVHVQQHEGGKVKTDARIIHTCKLLIEGSAIGEPGQRIGIGDALVFVQFETDLLHLFSMPVQVFGKCLSLGNLVARGLCKNGYCCADDRGARRALDRDALTGFVQNAVIFFQARLFLFQNRQQSFQF